MGKQSNRNSAETTDPQGNVRTFFVYGGSHASVPARVRKAVKLPKGTVLGVACAGNYDYDTNSIIGGEKLEPVVEAWVPSRAR